MKGPNNRKLKAQETLYHREAMPHVQVVLGFDLLYFDFMNYWLHFKPLKPLETIGNNVWEVP